MPGFRDFALFYIQSFYLYGLLMGGFLLMFLPPPLGAKIFGVALALVLSLLAALIRYRSRLRKERSRPSTGPSGVRSSSEDQRRKSQRRSS